MALELLVLTLDDIVSRHDDQHGDHLDGGRRERRDITDDSHAAADALVDSFIRLRDEARAANGELARAHGEALLRACERAFVAACAQGRLHVRPQVLTWMEAAERNGVRLALGSTLSSRMICALMECALGLDWTDRFSVVATADALSADDAEDELYRLILRTTAVPAHHALLVTAKQGSQEIARGVGMHTIHLTAQGCIADATVDGIDAPWLASNPPRPSRATRAAGAPFG